MKISKTKLVKIIEESKKSDGMRSVRKGADNNPRVTKMDFLPDDVLDDIANDADESVEEAKKRKKKKPSDNKQYAKGRSSANKKGLDQAVAAYNRAKKTPGKADDMAAIRQREKFAEGKSTVRLSESQIRVMINDAIEEAKLDAVLNEIEDQINEKKKKKKSGSRKLSKAVKKSLDKKADRRCLTRGSVYREFRAGLGAYYTSGSRKGMSPHQWAHARVNSANPSKKWAKVKKRKKCPKKKKK
tara:strand:- start:1034 stop:1762 length:729 start_codon:yes stop_codon:yes gene_type:complete